MIQNLWKRMLWRWEEISFELFSRRFEPQDGFMLMADYAAKLKNCCAPTVRFERQGKACAA